MKTIPIKESVHLRPAMYVGSTDAKGVYTMLESFLLDLIASSEMEEVEIQLNPDNVIRITSSDFNVNSFIEKLEILKNGYDPNNQEALYKVLDLSVITTLSDKLKIEAYDAGKIHTLTGAKGEFSKNTDEGYLKEDLIMEFIPDRNVFQAPEIEFEPLNNIYQRIAYINPDIKIISVDDAHDEYQRRVFYYPKGLSDKMDSLVSEHSVDAPSVRLDIEEVNGDYHYSISLSVLDYPSCPYIQSFAGFVDTIRHGSLVDGAIKGIILAISEFSEKKGIKVNISDKSLKENGLILLASVLGPEYNFGGSMKLELEMPEIENAVKEIVNAELARYLHDNEDKTLEFINRFSD
ncbi:MAG: hypothetical protein ACK5KT_04145 [Dysgonomonas sp.]